jgi:hypothetical protein
MEKDLKNLMETFNVTEIALNLWKEIIKDTYGSIPVVLDFYLTKATLYNCINAASDIAKSLINNSLTLQQQHPVLSLVYATPIGCIQGSPEAMKKTLFVLRYLSRFCPGGTVNPTACLNGLLARNKRCRVKNESYWMTKIRKDLKWMISNILLSTDSSPLTIRGMIDSNPRYLTDCIPKGAAYPNGFSSGKSVVGKAMEIEQFWNHLEFSSSIVDPFGPRPVESYEGFGHPSRFYKDKPIEECPIDLTKKRYNQIKKIWGKGFPSYNDWTVQQLNQNKKYYYNPIAKFQAVPKNYKIDRGICMEPPYQQFKQKLLADLLVKRYTANAEEFPGIELSKPEYNRLAAMQGSCDGSLVTIDLSNASDAISTLDVLSLFPDSLIDSYLDSRSTIIEYDIDPKGKSKKKSTGKVRSYFGATMGQGETPILQSILNLGICYLASYYNWIYSGESPELWRSKDQGRNIYVYNDDIIVSDTIAETVLDLLTIFGYQVNENKTFTGFDLTDFVLTYRESCGGEFVCGYDISQQYWPRTPFQPGKVSKEENILLFAKYLCNIQHTVCDYPNANEFLSGLLKPYLGFAPIGTPYDCIWSNFAPLKFKTLKGRGPIEHRQRLIVSEIKVEYAEDNHQRYQEIEDRVRYTRFLTHGSTRSEDPLFQLLGIPEEQDMNLKVRQRVVVSVKRSNRLI